MDTIRDGKGGGYLAEVGSDNKLRVSSKSSSIQHNISAEEKQAYQVIGSATLSSGTVTILHIKNTSSLLNMVITYLRHQVVGAAGGTAFPNSSNYFSISLGRTYSSGGSVAITVNVNAGSGNTAQVLVYEDGPTLTGTAKEIDKWYTKSDGDMNTFSKEGALIIPPNSTMEIAYIGDQTSGTIYARISFIMEEQ